MSTNNTNTGGKVTPGGGAQMKVTRNLGNLHNRKEARSLHLRRYILGSHVAKASIWWKLSNFLRYRWREIPQRVAYTILGGVSGAVLVESKLQLVKHQLMPDGSILDIDFGVVSRRVVTTAGVNFIVDAFQNLVELELMKFHGFGTGTGAEAVGDTALGAEFTTEYATDNTRPTGSQTEGSANQYVTAATFSPDSGGTLAVTEHAIFSQAATGGGTCLDRSKFTAVNLTSGSDSLTATYTFTVTSGG